MGVSKIDVSKAKGWTLGSVRKTTTGKRMLVFSRGVEILVDGRPIDLGEFNLLYFNDAIEDLDFKLEGGYIPQDEYDAAIVKIKEKNITNILKGKFKVS